MPSLQEQIRDALVFWWFDAVDDLVDGDTQFIPGQIIGQEADTGRMPFLMAHTPGIEETWLSAHFQTESRYSFAWELWTRHKSQSELMQYYADFRASIRALPELTADPKLVRYTYCPLMAIDESRYQEKQERGLLVQTVSVVIES